MARIVENPRGRRMVRLTGEDVVAVVQAYQRRVIGLSQPAMTADLMHHLTQSPVYLPEDPS